MPFVRCASTALVCAAACAAAQAGRPLVTNDADVLADGDCELEAYTLRDRRAGSTTRGGIAELGCGIGALHSQLALAAIRESEAGVADLHGALLGKTALLRRDGDGFGIALGWGFGVLRTPGNAWRHDDTNLTLIVTRRIGDGVTAHANLGWSRNETHASHRMQWALAAEKALAGGIDLMAEAYGDDRSRPWLGLGARWTANDTLSVNAAWALQHVVPRARQFSLGVRIGF